MTICAGRFRLPVLVAVGLLLTGCGAASGPEPGPSTPTVSAPTVSAPTSAEPVDLPGFTLRELGLTHGPVDQITLPESVTVLERIDQPNVITLVLAAEDGVPAAEHLVATLPDAGFEVTASVPGSLTFTGPGWDGAFTTSAEVSGFTLRRT